jgi:hypothetical protein
VIIYHSETFVKRKGEKKGEVEGPSHINSMDAIGVSLAAAQGLYQLSKEQAARIEELEELKGRVEALERAIGASPSPQSRLPGGSQGWWLEQLSEVVSFICIWCHFVV